MSEQVRIVVGEGRAMRRGLLRFVLEGEGYQVVAEATTAAELGRVLAVHRPDLVVLDDGIGAMAVGMTHEMVPDAKIILVWPRAVVPVGGDARVDPSDVLRELGPAVARLATPAAESGLAVVPPLAERPPWIERVRKDRSALRERLAKATPPPSERPSVTQLQRRGQRLHPISRKPSTATEGTGTGEPIIDDTGPAPVVILPPGQTQAPKDSDQPDDKTAAGVVVPIGAAAAAAAETEAAAGEADAAASKTAGTGAKDAAGAAGTGAVAAAAAAGAVALGTAARNRRIGAVVLTGAAATTALVVALVLPNNRLPAHVQSEPTNPTTAPTTPGGGTVSPTNPPPSSPGPNEPDGGPNGGGPNGGPGGNGGHDDDDGGNGIYPPVPRYARAFVYGRN